MRSPDPVSEPRAYQELLLSLLGDDDPAEAQGQTLAALQRVLADAGERLRERPAEGEWSVLECVGHIVDAEVVYSGRYRWILAHDEPPLIGYDQDRWVTRLGHQDDEPQELLDLFGPLRTANLALWRRTSDADKARVGQHSERGPESFDLSFRLIGGHDRFHLAQARRTLAAVGATAVGATAEGSPGV
jgi:hypothetical protein